VITTSVYGAAADGSANGTSVQSAAHASFNTMLMKLAVL